MGISTNQERALITSILSGTPFYRCPDTVMDASALPLFPQYEHTAYIQLPGKPGTKHELHEYAYPEPSLRAKTLQKIREWSSENSKPEENINSIIESIPFYLHNRIKQAASISKIWKISDLIYYVLFGDKKSTDERKYVTNGVVFDALKWVDSILSNHYYTETEYKREDTLISDFEAAAKEENRSLLERIILTSFAKIVVEISALDTGYTISLSRLAARWRDKARTSEEHAIINQFLKDIKDTGIKKSMPSAKVLWAMLVFCTTLPLQALSFYYYILPSIATFYLFLNAPFLVIAFMGLCHILFLHYLLTVYFAPMKEGHSSSTGNAPNPLAEYV